MARIARADVGPLAAYADGFRDELAGLGYTTTGVVRKLWEFGRLSDWMVAASVGASELTAGRVQEFVAAHAQVGERPIGPRTLRPLLRHLRDLGVAPAETIGATPVEQLVSRYRAWLVEDRGLAARTVGRYQATARRFLEWRGPAVGGGCGVEDLSGTEVTGFLLAECSRIALGSAKGRVAELRSLLRFLFVEGMTDTALAASVPPVAGWRDTALPPTLTPPQVAAIVDSCDRTTATGRRDFAILMVLARLGLRAAEVSGLELADLDWRAGEIVVRGKARRHDRLPLPGDVGKAIVAYLRHGRPEADCRAVFLTRYAPLRALSPVTVSKVVVAASRRAGMDPAVLAHRLRHSLAADLLRHGAALPEIAQVLRHRDLATTAIYAKVDHAALRELALPWPQVTR
jgi:integrase/recombinase XerD